MFLDCKYSIFLFLKIDNFHICYSMQTVNSVAFSRLSKYSLSSIKVLSSNSPLAIHTKKVIFFTRYFSQQRKFFRYDCFCQNNLTKSTKRFPSFLFKLFYRKYFLKTRKHNVLRSSCSFLKNNKYTQKYRSFLKDKKNTQKLLHLS